MVLRPSLLDVSATGSGAAHAKPRTERPERLAPRYTSTALGERQDSSSTKVSIRRFQHHGGTSYIYESGCFNHAYRVARSEDSLQRGATTIAC
jgi:hypothetical protein